jgi:hypothetical protein
VDDASGQLRKTDGNLDLDFACIEVNAAFAHWRRCNERLRELVNSHPRYSGTAFSALFALLRRDSRLAELGWVSALYAFRWMKETEGKDAGRTEDSGGRN